MINLRKSVALSFVIVALPAIAQLDSTCTVSVLNCNARVDANGNWTINNVPAFFDATARATCVGATATQSGQSSTVRVDQTVNAFDGTIQLGAAQPIPDSLAITTPGGALTGTGGVAQLNVIATYPGGSTADVTPALAGTTYNVSNPATVTVAPNGLVTAISTGTAIVQAVNLGTQAMTSFTITGAVLDSDGDGIPDSVEIANGLNPHDPTDAAGDLDGDGLTNLEEYRLGTNMRNADTDGDGISDLIELRLGLNPLVADPTTTVQGSVVNSSGQPIAGASVSVLGYFKSVTAADGTFYIANVPVDAGNLTVQAFLLSNGNRVTGFSNSVIPSGTAPINVGAISIVQQNGVFTGLIFDPQRRPVPGALVTTVDSNGNVLGTGVSDPTGHYRLTGFPANAQFEIIAYDSRTGFIGSQVNIFFGHSREWRL
jgi:hypothetical protein